VNIKKGLARAWIVLTIFYVANVLFNNRPTGEVRDWWSLLWIFVMPPLGLAVVLAGLGWVLSGLHKTSDPGRQGGRPCGNYVNALDAIRAAAPPLVQKRALSCIAVSARAPALAAAAHNARASQP
jgi:hypothetical protein